MKNRSGEKIKLASIDELLGVVNEESAMEIEISKIHPFKNHPFKVLDDEKMQDLVESVRINGVLTPVLLIFIFSNLCINLSVGATIFIRCRRIITSRVQGFAVFFRISMCQTPVFMKVVFFLAICYNYSI